MTTADNEDPDPSPSGEYPRRPRDARRAGARILDTAEGVLAVLRRCRVDRAFVELMQTADRHGINPIRLADALVAIAENHLPDDVDAAATAVAHANWGHLLDVDEPTRAHAVEIASGAVADWASRELRRYAVAARTLAYVPDGTEENALLRLSEEIDAAADKLARTWSSASDRGIPSAESSH
ncbi:MAG TPA: hypothetical protein VFR17_08085 [Mycobacterium sp.]|nr:hypothetical protein [Mycobacterium sp.]